MVFPGRHPTPAPGMTYAPGKMPQTGTTDKLQDAKRTRENFPETWVWGTVMSGYVRLNSAIIGPEYGSADIVEDCRMKLNYWNNQCHLRTDYSWVQNRQLVTQYCAQRFKEV